MLILQMLAARMAGLDQIIFHTIELSGTESYRKALAVFDSLTSAAGRDSISRMVAEILCLGYEWGVSNGT